MRPFLASLLLFAAILGTSGSAEASDPTYQVHDLGTFAVATSPFAAKAESAALDINSTHTVVGYATGADGQQKAFRWDGDKLEQLPELTGAVASGATGITDSGIVIGQATFADFSMHAIRWQNDTVSDLGTLGGRSSFAWDINEAGTIAGWAETEAGGRHAVIWRDGKIQDLDSPLSNFSEAYGISTDGDVFGMVLPGDGAPMPFRWQAGKMELLPLLPGGVSGYAVGENAEGVVAGIIAYADGTQTAAIWKDGKVSTLLDLLDPGVLIGSVLMVDTSAITDDGTVLGGAARDGGPLVWTKGKTRRLPQPDAHHSGGIAQGASPDGWIVGITFIPGSEGPIARATLWIPRES